MSRTVAAPKHRPHVFGGDRNVFLPFLERRLHVEDGALGQLWLNALRPFLSEDRLVVGFALGLFAEQ